ncbi:MAG: SDR family oxidoreductase [Ilumatobacteraceae bacterium]
MSKYPFTSALVTGASSGIGAEMARLLGDAGVPTVLVARRGERLREIAARYEGFEVLEADLATTEGQSATAERISSTDHPVDLVVNNAGFGTSGVFHELDVDRLCGEIDVNIQALTVLSHAALVAMVPRGRGFLLNVSSVASFQASPGLGVYAATKAYVTSLSEALHAEVNGSGVHVTALCPGLTKTEFQDHSNTTGLAARIPDLAWTSVEQVASTGLNDVASNKTISVPGLLYKSAVTVSDVMPRSVTRMVSGLITR